MEYPEEFAAKVRALFPDDGDIEQCLQSGSDILGRILDDNQVRFSPGQIIQAFETGQTDELLAEARKGQQIWDLYREWGELKVSEMSAWRKKAE
jgi:hypothetical protein